jgi:hypothetical protein
VTGVNEVAGILNGENRFVPIGALDRLAAMGCEDLSDRNVLVLEKAVCGFGLCPISASLIDRAFRSV